MNSIETLAKCGSVSSARALFPGVKEGIYFDTSAHGLMPAAARETVLRYMEADIRFGGTPETMRETLGRVRKGFARLIGAGTDEIAITKNVSEGLNAIVTSLPWQPGDNAILCPEVEHPNGIYCLYNMSNRFGIEIREIPADHGAIIPATAMAEATDERTRLVLASSVTFSTGARTDLSGLAAHCRKNDTLLLVDGAQSIGALAFDVGEEQIDALAVGASKFLCGPPGLGFLYVRRERAENMRPASLSRYGVDLGDAHEGESGGKNYVLMPGARRFESGSYNYIGLNALEPSLEIFEAVTVANIEQHVLSLARQFANGLSELGLSVLIQPDSPAFSHLVVLLDFDGPDAFRSKCQAILSRLRQSGVKLSIRDGRLRFGFHLYNTPAEVETVLSLIRAWLASIERGGSA